MTESVNISHLSVIISHFVVYEFVFIVARAWGAAAAGRDRRARRGADDPRAPCRPGRSRWRTAPRTCTRGCTCCPALRTYSWNIAPADTCTESPHPPSPQPRLPAVGAPAVRWRRVFCERESERYVRSGSEKQKQKLRAERYSARRHSKVGGAKALSVCFTPPLLEGVGVHGCPRSAVPHRRGPASP